MTTGTDGNDTLTNRSDASDVVDALGGDDVITARSVYLYNGTSGSVVINGGDGFDTLILNDRIMSLQGSGFNGSLLTRPGSSSPIGQTSLSWTSIERLELTFSTYYFNG